MTATRLIYTILLLFLALPVQAADILIVQSMRVKAYDAVADGFRSAVGRKCDQVALSDLDGEDVTRTLKGYRSRLILAIGVDALREVMRIKDVPILYTMVLNPETKIAETANVSGVGMNIPPERQLAFMKQVLPRLRKVGLLYDPTKTGALARRAVRAAETLDLEIVTREVRRPREVPGLIDGLKGAVQLFWLLPDPTVVTPQTLEYLPLVAVESRVSFAAFSDQYLKNGALLSIGIDPVDIGRQAAELAERVLAGTAPRNVPPLEPRRVKINLNTKVARQLGIVVNRLSEADVVIHQ
ncbi:MAG: ABC transporter substrate-binding protein [Desulfuromonadales bacterium]|nr:MAG: ABC transporter substrate-binding protein [Desulfuromonadales bacterium]